MRIATTLLLAAAITLTACSDTTSPVQVPEQPIDLLQEFGTTGTAVVDKSGVGASMLPDSLKLSAEQKAKLQELHDAFKSANAADLAALKAIEDRARAARQAGKSRAEVQAILDQAKPIVARLEAQQRKLHEAVWAVYTPAQQAWIRGNAPRSCEKPQLTEEQIQKIRALKAAFESAVKEHIALIRQVHAEAQAARAAGASEERIKAILAKAEGAMKALREAEQRLHNAIMDVLTPEQRARWCAAGSPGASR